MAVSEAKKRANKKYDSEHYDQVLGRLPKGTKEKILAAGYSINGFLVEAVKEKFERIEKGL